MREGLSVTVYHCYECYASLLLHSHLLTPVLEIQINLPISSAILDKNIPMTLPFVFYFRVVCGEK
jgi:hypothetical protein